MEKTNDLILGMIWHDIGKFKQRARLPGDQGKNHMEIGATWLEQHYDSGLIIALVSTHHGSVKETWESNISLIGYEADNCAASERKAYDPRSDIDQEWHRTIPLANIFGRVRDPRRPADPDALPPPSYLPLRPLGAWQEPSLQEIITSAEEYGKLWGRFEEEFNTLKVRGLHHSIDLILHLLEKYTSTIPATTLKIYGADDQETSHKHPDISLFDHLKTTAALAHCLYCYYQDRYSQEWRQRVLKEEITGKDTWRDAAPAPFLLIGGDLSGVQRFIYTISSSGALKSLKGRSFFLELLTEHVVAYLLEALGLSRCNVIFTGGGHFYLLAPNTVQALDAVSLVRQNVNDYLWETFNGQLQMFIETQPLNKAELAHTSQVWSQLSARLENAKRRRWAERLEELFADPASPHEDCFTDQCAVCGREDRELVTEAEMRLCPPCRDQFRLGDRLQNVIRDFRSDRGGPVIAAWQAPPPDDRWSLAIATGSYQRFYRLALDSELSFLKPEITYHLNIWDLERFTWPGSRPFLAATYHARGFFDLESLVTQGFGLELAAVLRMDVDFLGTIFSRSLAATDDTLARKASLSRQLSLFFKYHLDGILQGAQGYEQLPRSNLAGRQPEDRLLAVTYAGGDDLFILGAWLDVLEAAVDIRNAFERFTANPYITVSAGLINAPAHFPIYRLAHLAGEAETQAKKAESEEKNRLGLGEGKVFTWEKLRTDAFHSLNLVRGLLQVADREKRLSPIPDGISHGFIFRLLQLCRDQRRLQAYKLPPLAWLFGRHQPRNKDLAQPWLDLKNYIFSTELDWQGLETALLWILMMMRKGEGKWS